MKANLILLYFALISLSACENNKEYKYVEIVAERGVTGGIKNKEEEPRAIKATSDSAAYMEAYKLFCISLKANKEVERAMGSVYSTPLEFKLLNDNGEDIADKVLFHDKLKVEKEIMEKILLMRGSQEQSGEGLSSEETMQSMAIAKIDSTKVKELTQYFRLKKDEFSNKDEVWYEPKSAPQYTNRNGLYCYFQTENGKPGNLRFRFQYYAEDWLFFSRVQFSIDGNAYEYIPKDTETDSGDGGKIWEWFDQPLTVSDKELIYALANAKNAKMKIIGRQYFDEKKISQEQIKSIMQTLELYNALGGEY